jgi:hypothetical protein
MLDGLFRFCAKWKLLFALAVIFAAGCTLVARPIERQLNDTAEAISGIATGLFLAMDAIYSLPALATGYRIQSGVWPTASELQALYSPSEPTITLCEVKITESSVDEIGIEYSLSLSRVENGGCSYRYSASVRPEDERQGCYLVEVKSFQPEQSLEHMMTAGTPMSVCA